MAQSLLDHLNDEIVTMKNEGLYKPERVITSPQRADIKVSSGADVLNFCANNYLGLADNPELIAAARGSLDSHGFGTASVRFICGTMDIHKELERTISSFLKTDDTILYSSCFDANGGLFETILGPEDAIISDSLNHASIIDGIRLCKAQRYRYKNNDMTDLENCLKEARANNARFKLIVTDGVFSMDGYLANLPDICTLADKYDALIMVDDCHATGFMGDNGAGTPEHFGVQDRIDIVTSTLGKALGGASGGFTSGRGPIIEFLRQRSRPYLFSNALAPAITAASLKVFEIIEDRGKEMIAKLRSNAEYFRDGMTKAGFDLLEGEHPIIPVMIYDAALAGKMADQLLEKGVYVTGFSYPVVPKGQARIRTQMSAAHNKQHLDKAIDAFTSVGNSLGVLKKAA